MERRIGQSTGLSFPSLLQPYRSSIVFILILVLFANLLALALPWIIKIIIDDILVHHDARRLHGIMLLFLGLSLTRSLIGFIRTYTSGLLGEKIVRDLRRTIYEHIPRLSLTSINAISPTQIFTRMTQDVDSMRRFLFGDAIEFIYSFLNFGFIIILLFYLNVKLTVISLLAVPLFAVVYFRLLPDLKHQYSRYRELVGLLGAIISEVLNGIRVVRSFAGECYEQARFEQRQCAILETASCKHYLNSWLWVGVEFFTSLGVIGTLWIGGMDVMTGYMSVGALVAFYTYLGMMFSPVMRMVALNASYQEAGAAMSRLRDILDIDDEVPHNVFPVSPDKIKGAIEFRQVHFQYPSGERVLRGIHFTVAPGETVGIVGASGAGKTTLITLLLRFFDPSAGEILVDGYRLTDLDLHRYRQQIAVVLQDDFLFSGTIAENIRYGRRAASSRDVIEAAKAAQAHSFISSLDRGYETPLGERGLNLSSGQRQRIAIARALLKNPSILILDEATSAVDAMTENAIQHSICHYMQGRTILKVAHRFSTIAETDKVIVLDKGKLVEMGDHNYLLKKQGYYSNLYFEQFKEGDGLPLVKT